MLALAVVLSTMHYEGDVTAAGGDYADVPFEVPAGSVECEIAHTDGSDYVILDWGVWGPDGFRGWGGGLTDNAIIGVDQSSRCYLPGPITPGTWTVAIGKAKLDTTGGHYSIDVTCRDNATLPVLPKAAYAPAVLSPDRRWYKGDFHVHSVQSGDAGATFDEIHLLAVSRGLDFLNMSDHNTVAQHALTAAVQPAWPDLLVLRGAEITTYSGHGNAVGISGYVDHRLGHDGRDVNGIVADVEAQGGIFIVNHPMLDLGTACIGCQWQHVDDLDWSKVSGIEVSTGNYDIGVQAFVPRVLALWDMLEDRGFKIAAVGGSDDHTAGMNEGPTGSPIGSPTTLVLADNLSEAAIMDAVKHGRTMVNLRGPDDPAVTLTLRTPDGPADIGDDLHQLQHVTLDVGVTGGDGYFVQIWKDGQKLAQKPVVGDTFTTTFDDTPDEYFHRYRLELITDTNMRVVVTSHFYVQGMGVGCGCRSTSPGGALLVALGTLLLARRRRG